MSEEKLFEFRAGDRVKIEGVLHKNDNSITFPLVLQAAGGRYTFTQYGQSFDCDDKPDLILIERPKKKIKKTVEFWVNVYKPVPGLQDFIAFNSKIEADECTKYPRLACEHFTCEIEVDEE